MFYFKIYIMYSKVTITINVCSLVSNLIASNTYSYLKLPYKSFPLETQLEYLLALLVKFSLDLGLLTINLSQLSKIIKALCVLVICVLVKEYKKFKSKSLLSRCIL